MPNHQAAPELCVSVSTRRQQHEPHHWPGAPVMSQLVAVSGRRRPASRTCRSMKSCTVRVTGAHVTFHAISAAAPRFVPKSVPSPRGWAGLRPRYSALAGRPDSQSARSRLEPVGYASRPHRRRCDRSRSAVPRSRLGTRAELLTHQLPPATAEGTMWSQMVHQLVWFTNCDSS